MNDDIAHSGVGVESRLLKRIFVIFVALLGYATLTQPCISLDKLFS